MPTNSRYFQLYQLLLPHIHNIRVDLFTIVRMIGCNLQNNFKI